MQLSTKFRKLNYAMLFFNQLFQKHLNSKLKTDIYLFIGNLWKQGTRMYLELTTQGFENPK